MNKVSSFLLLVSTFALATLNIHCSKLFTNQESQDERPIIGDEQPIPDCQTGAHPIYGSWLWLSSTGGFEGRTDTPESVGYTRKVCFNTDNTFAFYTADTLVYEGTFSLVKEDSAQTALVEVEGDSVTIIHYDTTSKKPMMPQVVKFMGPDSLVLADQCYDCFVSTYKRIKK